MTPEQYQQLIQRFDDLDHEIRTTRTDLREEIESLRDDLQRFTSDVHDRLSGRIARVAAFVHMPKTALMGDEKENA